MGWGRTLLLGDIGNRLDIGDCEQDIVALRDQQRRQQMTDRSQDARIAALETDSAELTLYVASLVRLLVAKGVMSAEQFSRFVDIVDESDGSSDGKYGGPIAP